MEFQSLEVIELNVYIQDGSIIKAESSGNRLRGLERAFINKSLKELIDIVPRVLATCSQAHIYALTKSMKGFENVKELMVMLEIIESHLRHPYIYWFPNLNLGKEYEFPSGEKYRRVNYYVKIIRNLMEKIGGKWPYNSYLINNKPISFKREELIKVIIFVEDEIIGMSITDFLNINSLEELRGDLKLLYEKARDCLYWNFGLRNYLTVGFPFEGSFNYSKINDKILEIEYDGRKVEVGPLAQALTFDPLIQKYHNKLGPSPFLREISRIKILAKLLNEIKDFENFGITEYPSDGNFINSVESIRGSLIHRYSVEKERVKDYHLIQPTSIIASKGGALEKVLEGLRVKDVKNPIEITLSVSSLDTCFVTKVKIIHNGHVVNEKRIGGFC
jgi:hydrogenase large subunit